jgi:Terminase large subunit, T4likevirus-type, N-terminal
LSDYALEAATALELTLGTPADLDWEPSPGAQALAFWCDADVVGYGGAAGGGKTDLLLGKAFRRHQKSIIFRSHFTDLVDVVTRGDQIQNGACTFVWGVKRRWDASDGRQVELGAIEHEKDKKKYRGRPHDFIGIDEAGEFPEAVFRFVAAWLRTTEIDQLTQMCLTFNPPTTAEGEWIVKYFAPWIDPDYKGVRPTPGELRWFVYADNKDVEVPGPDPVEVGGQTYTPKSRTFIPARLEDNPYLINTEYATQIENLPEPLRSQLRFGDFAATQKDDAWQVIPTAWIVEAQNRWLTLGKPAVTLRTVGVDPSRGGDDETGIAKLYGNYIELLTHPGEDVPDGWVGARLVNQAMEEAAPIFIDVIGIGSSVYDVLKVQRGITITPINVGAHSDDRDKTGRYTFPNIRSAAWWKLRELLDPNSGEAIALPPDPKLRNDLRSPRYKIAGGKIVIEPKEDIKRRLGRSPDRGEAVMLALYGANHTNIGIGFLDDEPHREERELSPTEQMIKDEIDRLKLLKKLEQETAAFYGQAGGGDDD